MLEAVPPPGGDSPPPETSDAQLIEWSITAPEHFAGLFDRHAVVVHRYLGRRVGELADDLLSETFLIAFRRRDTFRAVRVDVRPWLFGIATNLVREHRRAEQRRYQALARTTPDRDGDTVGSAETDDRITAQSLRAPLAGALAGLKSPDRDVLLLFAWGQLSYEEIAAVLDIPVGTVRSRLNRARRQTRAALGSIAATSEEYL